MKKYFIIICMLLQVAAAMAESVEIGGLKYILKNEDKTASISEGNRYNGLLVIPETVIYDDVIYTVTDIDKRAFISNNDLLSVTIPGSVKHVGDYAFAECSKLASVKMGDSVETIGVHAFSRSSLVSITFGSKIRTIGKYAFGECFALTQVYINDLAAWCQIDFKDAQSNPLFYSTHLYLGKKEIRDLVIPDGVTEIKRFAFTRATNLLSLKMNNDVISIGNSAFYQCSSLNSVIFSKALTSIGERTFYECSSIESIQIPDRVTTISSEAFYGCTKLENLKLSTELKIINKSAFNNCNSLTNIIIPSQVEFLYQNEFLNTEKQLTITMLPEYPPIAYSPLFPDGTKIVVPDESLELYQSVSPWSDYDIIPFSNYGPEKCAKPEIIYNNGKLLFTCQTPDVEFHYTVTSEDFSLKQTSEEVPVSAIYLIEVYASKPGYEDSDIATMKIDIRGKKGDVNGDGRVDAADIAFLVDIILRM